MLSNGRVTSIPTRPGGIHTLRLFGIRIALGMSLLVAIGAFAQDSPPTPDRPWLSNQENRFARGIEKYPETAAMRPPSGRTPQGHGVGIAKLGLRPRKTGGRLVKLVRMNFCWQAAGYDPACIRARDMPGEYP
jgi:hypothetical protein